MCCFSKPVELVADTYIFARSDNGRQFLVYSMSYAAPSELAMVLPLPVPPDTPEDAVPRSAISTDLTNAFAFPLMFGISCRSITIMDSPFSS